MDRKLAGLVGILILVLAGFYLSYTKGNNMGKPPNNNPSLKIEGGTQLPSSTPISTPAPTTTQALSAKTFPDGLIVEDLKIGSGTEVKAGDSVSIHYVGTLQSGAKFDSSYDRRQPFQTQIGVGDVIKGWDEGVVGMKVGGKRKLTIPPDLGYGSNPVGPIPANSTLIFELELLDVK